MRTAAAVLALVLASPAVASTSPGGFGLSVLVDGATRPEFHARGTVYVEAVRGREYALRITNPLPVRVAVALSVDGLNTIDAKHTPAREARKWVLAPYETVVIEGWQVSGDAARKFVFTGERSSYGAKLGLTENLGTLEAVFFREREVRWKDAVAAPGAKHEEARRDQASGTSTSQAPAPASDEYAATGMGGRTRHDVRQVFLDLEDSPAASLRIRYEFRTTLARLGVLPADADPLERRDRGQGFSSYCPER